MNSRERVYTALNHEKPDRVPINFRATDQIIDILYNHYGKDYYQLLDYFNVDFREVIPDYVGPQLRRLNDGTQFDFWGVGRKEVITDSSRDVCVNINPLKDVNDIDELDKYNWPSVDMFDFSMISKKCDEFKGYAISTEGIHAEGYHGVFHILTYLFGMERVMMDLVLNEDLMQRAIKRIMEFFLNYYERIFQHGRGKIDFLFYKDDFGTQNSLLISRDFFLKFFAPTLRQLVDLANNYDVTLILHSCGSVIKLIPDFIDIGIKALDPIQTSAKGMDIKVLKERFGDKLTFHGAIDTQTLLPKSNPQQVKEVVRNTIDILGSGGGYFFSPSHRIQQDTPLENVIAMYETANNCSL